MRVHHVVTGVGIDPAAVEEAIRLSDEKYCSVGAMIRRTAVLTVTYELVEEKNTWFAAPRRCFRTLYMTAQKPSARPLAGH